MATNKTPAEYQAQREAERERLEDTCQALMVNPVTDFVCIAPIGHAGAHDMIDAMFLLGLDENGRPVYRHAR